MSGPLNADTVSCHVLPVVMVKDVVLLGMLGSAQAALLVPTLPAIKGGVKYDDPATTEVWLPRGPCRVAIATVHAGHTYLRCANCLSRDAFHARRFRWSSLSSTASSNLDLQSARWRVPRLSRTHPMKLPWPSPASG